jgi:magnesium chelatase family protein
MWRWRLAANELINTLPGEPPGEIAPQRRETWHLHPMRCNQAPEGQAIDAQMPARRQPPSLNTAAARLGWSGRNIHRCLKVARTIADFIGASSVQITHVAEAVHTGGR